MKHPKRALACLLTAQLFLLCGCQTAGRFPKSEVSPEITLPPGTQSYVAPIGDAALEYTEDAVLYLPRHSGGRLGASVEPVTFSASRPRAESLTRALVAHAGDASLSSLGGSVKLALYGANPVEISRDAATVNLSASALSLSREELYIACQAIANTLTEAGEIHYVNFLVVDRPVGIDVANTLPTGSFSRSLSDDLTAEYERRLSRRGALNGEEDDGKPFSFNATLYFPVADAPGVFSEVRSVSFSSRQISDRVVVLLKELSKGSSLSEVSSPALPLLAEMLEEAPVAEYSEQLGGTVIRLRFSYALDEMLEKARVTRANCMASLCYTLCTFFPGAAGLSVTIGGQPVDTLMLGENFTSSVAFTDQVMKRADFAPMLRDFCTLYFVGEDGLTLTASKRPVLFYQRQDPRSLLLELSKGPQPYDQRPTLQPSVPGNGLTDADILGVALSGETALVNFAPAFLELGRGANARQERLWVYAMTNTLCENQSIQSVCFFVSGAIPEGFSGEIYWAGEFYPMK